MKDVGRVVLVVLVILTLHLAVESVKAKAGGTLDGRSLVAVEGYGARCAVLYTRAGGMAAVGSGSIHCTWDRTYRGDWRPAQPRSE